MDSSIVKLERDISHLVYSAYFFGKEEDVLEGQEFCDAIISYYHDILVAVHRVIEKKYGSRASLLVEECKLSLRPEQLTHTRCFYPDSSCADNIKAVMTELNPQEGPPLTHGVLIRSFESFFRHLLTRVAMVLDGEAAKDILDVVKDKLAACNEKKAYLQVKQWISQGVSEILSDLSRELEGWTSPQNDNNGFFTIGPVE